MKLGMLPQVVLAAASLLAALAPVQAAPANATDRSKRYLFYYNQPYQIRSKMDVNQALCWQAVRYTDGYLHVTNQLCKPGDPWQTFIITRNMQIRRYDGEAQECVVPANFGTGNGVKILARPCGTGDAWHWTVHDGLKFENNWANDKCIDATGGRSQARPDQELQLWSCVAGLLDTGWFDEPSARQWGLVGVDVVADCNRCGSGSYASGCGGSEKGTCYSCGSCSAGTQRTGCGGSSSGTCSACSTSLPSGASWTTGCSYEFCASGLMNCGSNYEKLCIDPNMDSKNCGACGASCSSDPCINGKCQVQDTGSSSAPSPPASGSNISASSSASALQDAPSGSTALSTGAIAGIAVAGAAVLAAAIAVAVFFGRHSTSKAQDPQMPPANDDAVTAAPNELPQRVASLGGGPTVFSLFGGTKDVASVPIKSFGVAIGDYVPSNQGEIAVHTGDRIFGESVSANGWASGFNAVTGAEGFFPADLVAFAGTLAQPNPVSARPGPVGAGLPAYEST
ncbi:hypothetical protein DFJ74DRAFT_431018 [Hyaloraphidium curvatum]|nr:hypothetical protein DFJ74DRAFT_431018 [Hyaloraphidium curvatum]